MGKTIKLAATDGHLFSAYKAEPKGKAKGAVIVIQEIFGVNSHIRSVADGFAQDGYVAIAPAMFERAQKNFEVGYNDDGKAKGIDLMKKVSFDMAIKDVEAAVKEASKSGKVGIVGYCWGGTVAWLAAGKVEGLSCAVMYYGGGFLSNQNLKPRVPVMGHFGEEDKGIPIDQVKDFAKKHPEINIFTYPAHHGFNCNERSSYDEKSAKEARKRTLEFFQKNMG